jgi:hypothetical protein
MEIVTTKANTSPILAIYGPEGIGKTTLSSRFPHAVHLLLEEGLPTGVEVQALAHRTDLSGVLASLRWLYEAEHQFQTLVIDTLDALEARVLAHVCNENRWQTIETPSFGKGWVAADVEWRRVLGALDHIRRKRGMTVVLIAHSSVERVDDPRAPSYTSYQLRLHRRARALVLDACDLVGFLSTDIHVISEDRGFGHERARADGGSQRYLFVEGRPAFAAKNRYGMPPKIPVDRDFDIGELTKYFPAVAADEGSHAAPQ